MAKLGDIARITPLDKSIESELPNVDDPASLQEAAKLVHSTLAAKLDRTIPTPAAYHAYHIKGRRWSGRMRLEVMYALWPRLQDKVMVDEAERNRLCQAVFDYLRMTKTVICIQRTGVATPAVWWVSDHWTPMTVSYVEPQTPTEAISEEDKTEPDQTAEGEGTLPCREPDCFAVFTVGQARSGHEYNIHKMVAWPTGERFYYSADDFTTQYVVDEIMAALGGITKPVTFSGLVAITYEKDPRLGKAVVRDHLANLVDAGLVVKTQPTTYACYAKAPEGSLPAPISGLLAAVVEEKQRQEEAKTVPWTGSAPTDLKTGIELAAHIASTTMGNLKSVQDTIEKLTAFAAEKDREIAGLRQRLMAAPRSSGREAELEAELAQVKIERDIYKDKVETFESALAVLRVR